MEDIRKTSGDELEGIRLLLSQRLQRAEVDANASEQLELSHLLGAALLRLGSPLDAEEHLNNALALLPDAADRGEAWRRGGRQRARDGVVVEEQRGLHHGNQKGPIQEEPIQKLPPHVVR